MKVISNKIKCPNFCFNGKIKHYSDVDKALYDMIECDVCKGTGEIPIHEYDKINSTI